MADSPDSKRSGERISVNQPMNVQKPSPIQGVIVDIAEGGCAAVVPTAIPEGTSVEMVLLGVTIVGVVKMMKAVDGGFRLGVQFNKPDPSLVAKAKALQK